LPLDRPRIAQAELHVVDAIGPCGDSRAEERAHALQGAHRHAHSIGDAIAGRPVPPMILPDLVSSRADVRSGQTLRAQRVAQRGAPRGVLRLRCR
jgi:hypothetical protein